MIDQLLEFGFDSLAAPQQVGQRRPADDVAKRGLRRPAHRLHVVLYFEGGFLRVVHHPEQHRVHVHRHGIGGERLFGGEAGGDRPLIDPGRNAIDERHHPEESRPFHRLIASKTQNDRALPLLRDLRRLDQHEADQDPGNHRNRIVDIHGDGEAGEDRNHEQRDPDHIGRMDVRSSPSGLPTPRTRKHRNEWHLGSSLSVCGYLVD